MKLKIRKIIKYIPLLLVFILGLTPLIWFIGRGNILINGIDTNFPLNPLIWFIRRFYVWNNIVNAGADFSSSSAGLFFHLVQVIPYILGFKLQLVELFSLLFWFLLVVSSSFFLAKVILPKKFMPQILFTIFYSFNVYLFNTWENVKVTNLSLTTGIPLALGILILLDKGKITRKSGLFLSALAGIVLTGTGINPSYLISFFLVMFIYLIGSMVASPKAKVAKLINFLLVISMILMVNVFWILPTLNYVIKGVSLEGSIDKLGFANWVDSLSENTSLFNVFRLQGAWDWYTIDDMTGLPIYIPYALNYFHRLPFIIFSLIAPILAIFSLIFRKKTNNYLYLGFSIMLLVGVFLGAGTHAPTGTVFRYMLDNVPFFSLFRSPWYIFTPLVTLAYAGLIGLLFDRAFEYLQIKKQKVGKLLLGLFGIALFIGNLFYCYPLITGKIFRPGRHDSFYVRFPDYIFDAAKWLNEENDDRRIISYPDDEIENFKWGYRGIESLLHLLSNREIMVSSLNAPNSAVSRLIKEFYWRLKRQELDSALLIAEKLNISLIFEKKDQGSLSPSLPQEIVANYESKKFDQWYFYKLPKGNITAKIFSPSNLTYSYPYSQGQIAIPFLSSGDQIINPDDSEAKKISGISEIVGSAVVAENLQAKSFQDFSVSVSKLSTRLVSRNFSEAEFQFEIFDEGSYQPILERYHLEDFGINPRNNLNALLDDKKILLEVDTLVDSHVFYKPILFKKGRHKLNFYLDNKNLVVGGDFEKGEVFKRGGYGEGEVNYEIKEEESGKYLSITNYGTAEASADFKVSDFDPYVPYYVEVRYKQIYGNNGVIIPEQSIATTLVKAQNEALPNYPEWVKFGFYYDPVKTESEMKVFLISPFITDPLGTKIFYDDLVVHKVFVNNLVFAKRNNNPLIVPEVNFQKISPVLYRGSVDKAVGNHVIVFSENYSPEWQIRVFDEKGQPIKMDPPHFSVNLYANGWFFEKTPEKYIFEIYFQPQSLYNLGLAISGLTLLSSIGYFFFQKYWRHK
ncbi:MAG: alpha-(1-_3)-arabinofuranosyltransferase family protein [Patescibacteria group bacterium]